MKVLTPKRQRVLFPVFDSSSLSMPRRRTCVFPRAFGPGCPPAKIAGIYFVASILWILVSDQALGLAGLSAARIIQIGILKGVAFVAVSTWLVYSLLEKARAVEELRIHRAYLDELFDTAPEAICILDMNTRVLSVNQEFTRMFGYEKEEAVGRNILDLVVPDELRNAVEDNRHLIVLGERVDKETIRTRKDGTRVHVSMVAAPATLIGGVAAIHVVYRDLTDRKKAEQTLRESEERFRELLEKAPLPLGLVDKEGLITFRNERFVRVFGYTDEDVPTIVEWWQRAYPDPQYRQWAIERWDTAVRVASAEGRDIEPLEANITCKNGDVRVMEISGISLGKEFLGTFIDITERKRAEKQLQATAERLEAILEHAPVGIVTNDRECHLIEPNAAYQRICGYSAEELTGKKFTDLTHPDDIAKTLQSYEQLGSNKVQSYEMEKRYIHKDGKTIWVRVLASRLNEETNIGIIEDITERRNAQQALAESEERLRTIVELAPDGIFVIGEQGHVLQVNQAACNQLGYTRSQLLQLKIFDFIAPRFAQRVADRLKGNVPSGSYESAHIRSDGVEVPIELSVTKIVFRGNPVLLGITRDTSDRKRAEEQREKLEQQLRQSHKMEAVGRLAGGIAHDFNNLLMVIQSYAEILQESLPARDTLRKNTQEIMKAADRAAGLTRQMLAFSRKQILSPVVLDLNSVIDETAKMLRRVIGEDIEFHVSPAESLWPIMADSDQIVQVVMNLCVNARDAMPRGGTLTVATGNVTVGEGGVGKPEYVLPGDYAKLSVTDTGAGIDKELQAQIFEPFYTTKEVGKGTGLGLSTVYGIVKQSGGYVWVDSELGQGSCFTIYLPRVEQAIAPDMLAKAEEPSRGNETLLVAEDEEALREAVCDYLSSLGYTVLAAGSGLEALSAASQHEGHIDLLITDLVMPKMSGRELSQMLGSLRPDLKTIYMSGYSDNSIMRHDIQEMGATFLQKPFSLGTIARKVRETLGHSEAVQ